MNFRAGKKLFTDKKTHVMGILNITPDSFSDGGAYFHREEAIKRAVEIQNEGADIIDIGAQSTRPGYKMISPEEEWERLKDILPEIIRAVDIAVSVDTFYPSVAKQALDSGVHIINDVSGFENPMLSVVREYDCGCIIMYPRGGEKNIVKAAKSFFEERLREVQEMGIDKERICFDPGIGFEKSRDEDLALIARTAEIRVEEVFYMIAASRKRVTAMLSENPLPQIRLSGTLALHTAAQLAGANIIRAHDVKEAVTAARLTDELMKREGN